MIPPVTTLAKSIPAGPAIPPHDRVGSSAELQVSDLDRKKSHPKVAFFILASSRGFVRDISAFASRIEVLLEAWQQASP
jgi:hypothetical protein